MFMIKIINIFILYFTVFLLTDFSALQQSCSVPDMLGHQCRMHFSYCGVTQCDILPPSGEWWCNFMGGGSCRYLHGSLPKTDCNLVNHYCGGFFCGVAPQNPCFCEIGYCNCHIVTPT